MAKFFFHLRDHTDQLLDPDGTECADLNEVAIKALTAARDLIAEDARAGAIDMRYRIDVEDATGQVVHTIAFSDAVAIRFAP